MRFWRQHPSGLWFRMESYAWRLAPPYRPVSLIRVDWKPEDLIPAACRLR